MLTIMLIGAGVAHGEMTDPTRPASYSGNAGSSHSSSADKAPWVLTSTLVSAGRTLATINGQLVARGERIGNATVLDISSSSALLREGTREFRITLAKPSIRNIPTYRNP